MAFARAVQASNSIEGYDASLDDVIAAVDDEPTLSADEETRLALGGYRDAMTYVLQVAQDPTARVDEGLLKSLHFMMLKHRLDKDPGRWRPGEVVVVRESTGERVYERPAADLVPGLIAGAIEDLETGDAPVLVRAAMAHLNLVMVHPFRDGNGRMARALQTLILARDRIVAPVFSSIEEHLGRNTDAYYDVLGTVGQVAGARRTMHARGSVSVSPRITTTRERRSGASRKPSVCTPHVPSWPTVTAYPSGPPAPWSMLRSGSG